MTFFKLLRYDLKEGLLRGYQRYITTALVFLAFCTDLKLRLGGLSYREVPKGTLGDYFLYCFAGMGEFKPEPGQSFQFPIVWTLIFILLAYTTLGYPFHDLVSSGQNVLIRSKGRTAWWLSKCLWNSISVCVFFGIGWLAITLFSCLSGAQMTLRLGGDYIFLILDITKTPVQSAALLPVALLWMPLLVGIALNLLQMTLSLMMKPIFSFAVTAVILLTCAYYESSWLIGNYAMAVRSSGIVRGGILPGPGIIMCVIVAAGSIAAGGFLFRRYDILPKAENE